MDMYETTVYVNTDNPNSKDDLAQYETEKGKPNNIIEVGNPYELIPGVRVYPIKKPKRPEVNVKTQATNFSQDLKGGF